MGGAAPMGGDELGGELPPPEERDLAAEGGFGAADAAAGGEEDLGRERR